MGINMNTSSTLRKLLPLLLAVSSHLSAQHSLDAGSTVPRFGDCLVKQQVVYKSPGISGTDIIWDFSNLENINENYELRYVAQEESNIITGIEHRTMFYYDLSGDTLRALGYENPQTLMTYHKAEEMLVFPFPYGRSISSYFDGTGNYCNQLDIHLFGKSIVTADATGQIVLPGGDTLQHVLRVHTFKRMISRTTPTAFQSERINATSSLLSPDSIEWYLANDTSLIETDTWRWYAEGYRYPVFESIRSIDHEASKASKIFTTSFYYPPLEQYYELENDPENQEKRYAAARKDEKAPTNSDIESDSNDYQDDSIHYNCDIADNCIVINYLLKTDADISVSLYDIQGRQLSARKKTFHTAGTYQENLELDGLPDGEYLLRISVGSKVYGEKLINHTY